MADLVSDAVEALLDFAQQHHRQGLPRSGSEFRRLQDLDAEAYAACSEAGIQRPEVPAERHLRPFGGMRIPSYSTSAGFHVDATDNWQQAMRGILARRSIQLPDAPGAPAAAAISNATSKGTASSDRGSDPSTTQAEEGPVGIDGFRWKRKLSRGLTPKAFLLITRLWNANDRTIDLGVAEDAVYGENDVAPTEGMQGIRTVANRFFRKNKLPFVVSIDSTLRRVSLHEPTAKAVRKRTKKSAKRP